MKNKKQFKDILDDCFICLLARGLKALLKARLTCTGVSNNFQP